jgi:glycerol kinase
MQSLSDILGAPVDRPVMQETTVLGAAWLAGMKAGLYPDQQGFAETWARDRQFTPAMEEEQREAAYARWKRAVRAVIGV